MEKNKILIADDAELNRMMLSSMLGDKYDFVFAQNGVEAVDILSSGDTIDLVLLDVNMPEMDGFDVLHVMNEQGWIKDIPVIIISAEDNAEFITQAYHLGVTDYINRPFYSVVVERRVENTLLMHSNQKRLVRLVEKQVYEREKINNSMINIFSNIIEMRNQESGSHTLNVQTITNTLLLRLVELTDRYGLTKSDISLISLLSALHDIGKIKIPEAVLNKPGKLSPAEWEMMKTHTTAGDEILSNKELDQSSKFVRTARNICRWHHEKYDGKGYPDGLVGDDIPIEAQVVSMADVYDALTSERCYKKAFSHEKAMEMILGGECGAFNPLLTQCLRDVADSLKQVSQNGTTHFDFERDALSVTEELLTTNELPREDLLRRMLENERRKKEFFMEHCNDIQFEYDKLMHRVEFVNLPSENGEKRKVFFADRNNKENLLPHRDWDMLHEMLLKTKPENLGVEADVSLIINGKAVPYHTHMMAIWPQGGSEYTCVIGHFTAIDSRD